MDPILVILAAWALIATAMAWGYRDSWKRATAPRDDAGLGILGGYEGVYDWEREGL